MSRKNKEPKAGEKTYSVMVVHHCTSWEDVVASSPQEATERVGGAGSLCHQCSGEYEIGDPYKFIVTDPDTQEETEIDDEPEHPHTIALRNLVTRLERDDTCEVCGFPRDAGHAKTCELAQARALLGGAR